MDAAGHNRSGKELACRNVKNSPYYLSPIHFVATQNHYTFVLHWIPSA